MKKKIVLVITKSNWGGAQKYVFDIATNLSPEKYDILVAMGGTGALFQKLKEHGIRVIEIPALGRDISFFNDLRAGAYLWQLFKNEKPHVVHLNSSKIGGIGSFMARMARVPHIVFTLHGLALNEDRSFISKKIIQCLYWITIWFSHATIAVSETLRKQSQSFFPFVSNKIHVVKNCIAIPEFYEKEEARDLLVKLAAQNIHNTDTAQDMEGAQDTVSVNVGKVNFNTIDFGTITIGTIGELHPIKGQRYLLDAFKSITEDSLNNPSLGLGSPRLLIVGEGEERKSLENQIETLGLQNKAFLLGNIKDGARYLKTFDIFVLPSLSEGLAYVVLEAGSAGLPVIASRVGGIPEVIDGDHTGFLIESKSSKALALSLIDLIKDSAHRAKLGIALKKRVDTEFSLEKMVRETEKFYC